MIDYFIPVYFCLKWVPSTIILFGFWKALSFSLRICIYFEREDFIPSAGIYWHFSRSSISFAKKPYFFLQEVFIAIPPHSSKWKVSLFEQPVLPPVNLMAPREVSDFVTPMDGSLVITEGSLLLRFLLYQCMVTLSLW